jgi:HEAT repeat protein
MAVLLELGDPEATDSLRRALMDPSKPVRDQAVFLAGKHRVADAVPNLVSLINLKPFFKSAYITNTEIITALGRIRDSRALPALMQLTVRSWSLAPASLARMKTALYRSLDGYTFNEVQDLLKQGLSEKDQRIRAICTEILGKKRGGVSEGLEVSQ